MRQCSVCGGVLEGYGSNPDPLKTGDDDRCCAECDVRFVIPTRMLLMTSNQGDLLYQRLCEFVCQIAQIGKGLTEIYKNMPDPPKRD